MPPRHSYGTSSAKSNETKVEEEKIGDMRTIILRMVTPANLSSKGHVGNHMPDDQSNKQKSPGGLRRDNEGNDGSGTLFDAKYDDPDKMAALLQSIIKSSNEMYTFEGKKMVRVVGEHEDQNYTIIINRAQGYVLTAYPS